jgi:dTDP-4-dehydrorhamnose reductase
MKRRLLITGAGGLLGGYLARRALANHDLLALGRAELDISDPSTVEWVVNQFRPHAIINCAALSNVDRCESEPDLAFKVNAEGPGNLARACQKVGAELIHVSTDYVFDGRKTTPYTIEDEPNPISVYGQSKLAGEQAVRENLQRCYIVRPARIFGIGGRNFASLIVARIKHPEPIRAITDEIGSPTYARDLAERIMTILTLGQPGIYHVTNSGECSWYEFTLEVLRALGKDDVAVERMSGVDLKRPAKRPGYTVMRCLLSERLGLEPMRDWRVALVAFLKEVGEL